jgi:hypothetical protein
MDPHAECSGGNHFAALRLDELFGLIPGPMAQAITFRTFGASNSR